MSTSTKYPITDGLKQLVPSLGIIQMTMCTNEECPINRWFEKIVTSVEEVKSS